MASRADFTDDEWKTMKMGLMGAGLAVSASDGGLISSFKEAAAVSKTLQADAAQGGLIGELADMTKDRPSMSDFGGPDKAGIVTGALQSAVQILSQKAPDQLPVYQSAVTEVAQAAGEASKGMQPKEAATIETIRAAVGLTA